MTSTTLALGAAALLLLSGGAYAQNATGTPATKPCAQQSARGNTSGAPPDSQEANAQPVARGDTSGAPPDSQLAASGDCK